MTDRHCLNCGIDSDMKTWMNNHGFPVFIVILLAMLFWPLAIVFIWYFWGKYKCPKCNVVGKNVEDD